MLLLRWLAGVNCVREGGGCKGSDGFSELPV